MGFPSIDQFRTIIKSVRHHTWYAGKDEDGNVLYDKERFLPVLKAKGTVKIHGTNAGVCLHDGKLHCFSRTSELSVENDNYGFAAYVQANEEAFRSLFDDFDEPVELRGEYCGQGIMKGTAVNQLDKMFVIFSARNDDGVWLDLADYPNLEVPEARVYNILRFGTYEVDIDFNNPRVARDKMTELTLEVEAECPVGKHFGVSGLGEGIVWTFEDQKFKGSDFWFKTKGDKHKVTKTKEVVEIDTELLATIEEFVEATVTEQRLQQAISILEGEGKPISQKSTGDFLRWVANDILKEESDRMEDSGLEKSDVTKKISDRARGWWFALLNQQAGL
jgi:hypothetical protein